jgi:hypothetical protein
VTTTKSCKKGYRDEREGAEMEKQVIVRLLDADG